MKKITLEEIKAEYSENDICMAELLASIPATELSIDEAFRMFVDALRWSDSDRFIWKRGIHDIEELGCDNDNYNFDQLVLARFENIDKLKERVEAIGAKVLSVSYEDMDNRDDPETGFKQPDLSLFLDLDPGDNGEYSHVTLFYYIDRQGYFVITETAFRWE